MSEPKMGTWEDVETVLRQLSDFSALYRERLRAIEDRLAALDVGPNADAATRQAYDDVNALRQRQGRPALGLKRP